MDSVDNLLHVFIENSIQYSYPLVLHKLFDEYFLMDNEWNIISNKIIKILKKSVIKNKIYFFNYNYAYHSILSIKFDRHNKNISPYFDELIQYIIETIIFLNKRDFTNYNLQN